MNWTARIDLKAKPPIICVVDDGGKIVHSVEPHPQEGFENDSDAIRKAHLIAAAPEMLEYLGYALVYVQAEDHPFAQKIAGSIRRIIAKAEGKSE